MLFNSFPFLFVFLPATVAAFFLLRRQRFRLALLVAASYVFYSYADRWLPMLMLGSTAISFAAGLLIPRARRPRLALALGVAGLVALLAYFKYAAFASGYALDLVHLLTGSGFPGVREFARGIVLPIGISFYTFEGISYLVDVYRRKLEPERDPLRYVLFISFFPHLIAGPIVRYGILGPQLRRPYVHDWERLRSGVFLFSVGLAKKVLLADGLGHYVDPLLARPGELGLVETWAAVLGFGFQIYFDFAAYSDMALGLARIFGIELPWNFDRPYRAASPSEFWRRWHVTLSTWLRDYLYIPLGGNRHGAARRDGNLLATMAIGGLWHGASLNFLLWGVYHGLLLVGGRHAQRLPLRLPRAAAVALTFLLVMVGWVFFRLRSASEIVDAFEGLAGGHGVGAFPGHLVLYLVVSAAIVWGLPEEWHWSLGSWRPLRVAALGVVAGVSLLSLYGGQPFIYFQF